MNSKIHRTIPFFATERDLLKLLGAVAAVRSLQFVIAGLSDLPTVCSAHSLSKPSPTSNYLVADRDLVIEVRDVPQKDGGLKFAVDQLANPKTIAFRPGGLIEETHIVAGQLGTVSEDQTSLDLYRTLSSEMRKQFLKIKSYYVGEDASKLLDIGVRLTANPNSSRFYDLTREKVFEG